MSDFPPLGARLAAELSAVVPSHDGALAYAPCRVVLKSGAIDDRVYIARASDWLRTWGALPSSLISPLDLDSIESSPLRLDVSLADRVYAAAESGMGYYIFTVLLKDGRRLPFVTGDAVDFPRWPPGVDPVDAIGVLPHIDDGLRLRTATPTERGAAYRVCLFGD